MYALLQIRMTDMAGGVKSVVVATVSSECEQHATTQRWTVIERDEGRGMRQQRVKHSKTTSSVRITTSTCRASSYAVSESVILAPAVLLTAPHRSRLHIHHTVPSSTHATRSSV